MWFVSLRQTKQLTTGVLAYTTIAVSDTLANAVPVLTCVLLMPLKRTYCMYALVMASVWPDWCYEQSEQRH